MAWGVFIHTKRKSGETHIIRRIFAVIMGYICRNPL
jgi:hypothetical protein